MHCFELRYKVKETSHYNLYLTINVTLYCNTQIYNTPYLAQRSVSPCSNRMEARSFHLQVSPSGKTCVSLEGSDEPRRLKPIRTAAKSEIKKTGELQEQSQIIQLPKVIRFKPARSATCT